MTKYANELIPPCEVCGAESEELCGKGCPGEAERGPHYPHDNCLESRDEMGDVYGMTSRTYAALVILSDDFAALPIEDQNLITSDCVDAFEDDGCTPAEYHVACLKAGAR